MDGISVFQNIGSNAGRGFDKTIPGLKSWKNFGFDPPYEKIFLEQEQFRPKMDSLNSSSTEALENKAATLKQPL